MASEVHALALRLRVRGELLEPHRVPGAAEVEQVRPAEDEPAPVLGHRLILAPEARATGVSAAELVDEALTATAAPV